MSYPGHWCPGCRGFIDIGQSSCGAERCAGYVDGLVNGASEWAFEAGRLAAIRDDVYRYAEWLIEKAAKNDTDAWLAENYAGRTDYYASGESARFKRDAKRYRDSAAELRVRLADCRRWLEATR